MPTDGERVAEIVSTESRFLGPALASVAVLREALGVHCLLNFVERAELAPWQWQPDGNCNHPGLDEGATEQIARRLFVRQSSRRKRPGVGRGHLKEDDATVRLRPIPVRSMPGSPKLVIS